MKIPDTLQEQSEFTEREKETIENYLLHWGLYYYKTNSLQYWWSVVKEITGYDENEFIEKIKDLETHQSVLDLLKRQKKGTGRPLTLQELFYNLNGNCNKRRVYKQLADLKKMNMLKEVKIKVGSKEIAFYSLK
jgi:hypothetical protein